MNIVVTGASGALGAAVVESLQRRNHSLVLIDRVRSGAIESEREMVAGLSDREGTRRALAEAGKVLLRVDALVHLVGAFRYIPFVETTSSDWREMFAANVETAVNTIHAALPYLSDGGSITCIGAA